MEPKYFSHIQVCTKTIPLNNFSVSVSVGIYPTDSNVLGICQTSVLKPSDFKKLQAYNGEIFYVCKFLLNEMMNAGFDNGWIANIGTIGQNFAPYLTEEIRYYPVHMYHDGDYEYPSYFDKKQFAVSKKAANFGWSSAMKNHRTRSTKSNKNRLIIYNKL